MSPDVSLDTRLEHASRLASELGMRALARELRNCTTGAATALELAVRRMAHHLDERRIALTRLPEQAQGRAHALRITRVLATTAISARTRDVDHERERFVRWLRVERTKFLMSTKADALLALDEQLRHPRDAVQTAHVVADDLLFRFSLHTRLELRLALGRAATRLAGAVDHWLLELGETMSHDALAGIELASGPALRVDTTTKHETGEPAPSLVERIRLASRRRAILAARDVLVDLLERGSQLVIERDLEDHDLGISLLEARLCELLESWCETLEVACAAATAARGRGEGDVVAAIARLQELRAAVTVLETGAPAAPTAGR